MPARPDGRHSLVLVEYPAVVESRELLDRSADLCSSAEFGSAHKGDTSKFAAHDANKDGFLSADELKGAEGKCGEGKCGGEKAKAAGTKAGMEGKCGEGKCGGKA